MTYFFCYPNSLIPFYDINLFRTVCLIYWANLSPYLIIYLIIKIILENTLRFVLSLYGLCYHVGKLTCLLFRVRDYLLLLSIVGLNVDPVFNYYFSFFFRSIITIILI